MIRLRPLSPIERAVYNDGERLIPGVTHDLGELTRHRSSYAFFRAVIEHDQRNLGLETLSIADLGCGAGYGAASLAEIPGAVVTAVDVSAECISYAHDRYDRPNVEWVRADVRSFVGAMADFDYVVSRGVLEHITDGLSVAAAAAWSQRLLFDVPFDEPASDNDHHVLSGITEVDLLATGEMEVLFEDIHGVIYDRSRKPAEANMIMGVASRDGLDPVTSMFAFPLAAVRATARERLQDVARKVVSRLGRLSPTPTDTGTT